MCIDLVFFFFFYPNDLISWTGVPVTTKLWPVVSVDKSFQTVYVESIFFFFPLIALGVMETCMQKCVCVCVFGEEMLEGGELSICE